MSYVVVIPARLKSTRLPEKPLIRVNDKSIIQRTYEQCLKAVPHDRLYIATDSTKIQEHCLEFGAQVTMTSDNCLTGTDRVYEFSEVIEADHYINVQGDEPVVNPDDIKKVIEASLNHPDEVINGYAAIEDDHQYFSTSVPKVVFDHSTSRLVYMSRAPIPGHKSGKMIRSWRQICIYAFPKNMLKAFSMTKEKTPLEAIEDIEILRFIELGYQVKMIELSSQSLAIDTPEDVEQLKKILN